jgi:hypothetical protein
VEAEKRDRPRLSCISVCWVLRSACLAPVGVVFGQFQSVEC